MKFSKMLSLLTLVFVFTIFSNVKAETFKADKKWSAMKAGDVIYFDNSGTNWDKVYIHIWHKKDDNNDSDSNKDYKSWDEKTEMTKVEGTDNIYSFTVTSDMTDSKYNMVIFRNGQNGEQYQTIDLGFIEEGFAYKIDSTSGSKKIGYWYLYDKSDITKHLEDIQKYQEDKEYYSSESYGDLDKSIQEAVDKLKEEIRLNEEKNNDVGTGKYYIEIDEILAKMDELVKNLKTDKGILEDKIKEIEEKLEQDKDKYTDESIEELKKSLNEAKSKLESEDDITIEDLKASLNSINEADNNLEEKIVDNNTSVSDKDAVDTLESNATVDNNPKTYDGIMGYIVLGAISLGLAGLTFKKYLFR